MIIKLTNSELAELNRQDPHTASDGGFQNYIVQLQRRANEHSGELNLSEGDLKRISRYAFGYKNGGWQKRLMDIFSRSLGSELTGMTAK